jgi:hypothetical protein
MSPGVDVSVAETPTNPSTMALTDDDKDEVLLAGRYGDLDDVREFVSRFGSEPLADIRDENDNCILHMVCGNGHLGKHTLPLS